MDKLDKCRRQNALMRDALERIAKDEVPDAQTMAQLVLVALEEE